MTDNDFPAFFAQLPIEHRAALLANPRGTCRHTSPAASRPTSTQGSGTTTAPGYGQLDPLEATALTKERARLDQWWERRSEADRAALIEHRGGPMPAELRDAVMDHIPGGVVLGDDLVGPFTVPPMMAAYLEMVAGA